MKELRARSQSRVAHQIAPAAHAAALQRSKTSGRAGGAGGNARVHRGCDGLPLVLLRHILRGPETETGGSFCSQRSATSSSFFPLVRRGTTAHGSADCYSVE